jgi:hypothetical protein
MKKLSRSQRRVMMVEAEVRKLTQLHSAHCGSPDVEGLESGLAALDDYWRAIRSSQNSRRIRFYVSSYKSDLLLRMGRLSAALTESNRSLALSANPYAQITQIWAKTTILVRLGQCADAFRCAMSGLQICSRISDVNSAADLIREIVRLDCDSFLEELASRHGRLVIGAGQLPNQRRLLGGPPGDAPLEVLRALQGVLTRNTREPGDGTLGDGGDRSKPESK